jgi:hypothetical protein
MNPKHKKLNACKKLRWRMRNLKIILSALILATCGITAVSEEIQWVSLFNGKDLTGWRNYGAEKWLVSNGEILGEAVTEAYGYLATEKTYQDFEMKFKFKADGKGNSGLFYHSKIEGVDITGVQVEVDPNPGMHTGGLYESGGRGWLIQPDEAGEKAMKTGEWNEVRFKVTGAHVVTFVNGQKIADYQDPAPKYTDGVIALQLHSGGKGKIRFKDLYIRDTTKR